MLTLGWRQARAGLALEPDVGVEAVLMAGMAGRCRAAARLADVADQKRRLPSGMHLGAQGLDELQGDRLAPVAVAADADRLVPHAVKRKGLGALDAAGRIKADRLRWPWRRRFDVGPVEGAATQKHDQRNDETLHLAQG